METRFAKTNGTMEENGLTLPIDRFPSVLPSMLRLQPFTLRTSPIHLLVLIGLCVSLGCPSRKGELWGELESLKNRSNAFLENGAEKSKDNSMLRDACDGFRRLTVERPKERLGFQNLSIALLARIKKTDPIDAKSDYDALSEEFSENDFRLERTVAGRTGC